MKKICKHAVEWIDNLGFNCFQDCGRPTKYNVKYKSPHTNQIINNDVCGIHKNRIESWARNYKKLTGHKIQIELRSLNNQIKCKPDRTI